MNRKFVIGAIGAFAMGLAGLVALAPVSQAAGDVIKQRQAAMKSVSGAMKVLAETAKGEAAYDGAAITQAAYTIANSLTAAGTLFPQGSVAENSRAKPEIWEKMDDFKAALGNAIEGAQNVAATTDEASFKTAFGEFGKACGACHKPFRAPAKQ